MEFKIFLQPSVFCAFTEAVHQTSFHHLGLLYYEISPVKSVAFTSRPIIIYTSSGRNLHHEKQQLHIHVTHLSGNPAERRGAYLDDRTVIFYFIHHFSFQVHRANPLILVPQNKSRKVIIKIETIQSV